MLAIRRLALIGVCIVVVGSITATAGWYWRNRLIGEARASLDARHFAAADAATRTILRWLPNDRETLDLRARYYLAIGEAVNAAPIIARLPSPSAELLRARVGAHAEAGEWAPARDAMLELADIDPECDAFAAPLLKKYTRASDRQTFFEFCRDVAAANPERLPAFHRWMAESHLQYQDHEAELAERTVVHRLRPNDAEARNELAETLLRLGRGGEASQALTSGDDALTTWLRSRASLQKGEVAEFKKLAATVKPHLVRVEPSPLAGAQACVECHRERSAVQAKSPHALTCSAALDIDPTRTSSGGWVRDPISAHSIEHLIERRKGKVAASIRSNGSVSDSLELYAAMGSGRHGITFLGRSGQGVPFEYRMTNYREGGWDLTLGHERKNDIGTEQSSQDLLECLRCHNSNVPAARRNPLPKQDLLGVRCESCHGPGENHVRVAKAGAVNIDSAVLNPKQFDKEQSVELCANCHVPKVDRITHLSPMSARFPPLGFRASKCFQKSSNFTCITCHDPHDPTIKPMEFYDAACIKCHSDVKSLDCPPEPKDRSCCKCHMPHDRGIARHSAFANHYISRRR